MVVDTSVLVAIVLGEPEEAKFLEVMRTSVHRLLSAVSLVEAGVVLMQRGAPEIEHDLDRLIERAGIMVIPVDEEQAILARAAYRSFGKGRHRAGLNFGDCFSYALSIRTGEPLLFKGDDFTWTDVTKVFR
jgi:ribonuclease VapC